MQPPSATLFAACLGLLLCGLWSPGADARGRMEVIELQQRPAQEVIPLIRPFLQPGDGLSGSGFKLFVRSDPDTLSQIRQMLETLDQGAVNLMISVRHGHQRDAAERAIGAHGAAVVHDGDVDGVVAIHGRDRNAQADGGEVQRVRGLAGEPVFIRAGSTLTRPYGGYRVGADGRVRVQRGYATEDRTGGFFATVQLQSHDRVRVELSTRDAHPRSAGWGRSSTALQQVATVVTGRLGQWIAIGGVGRQVRGDSSGLLHSGSARASADDTVAIKVERLD